MSEKPSKLLADFLVWAKESGEATVTSSEFRELVERTPLLRYATIKGVQWVKGVGLSRTDTPNERRYGDEQSAHEPVGWRQGGG